MNARFAKGQICTRCRSPLGIGLFAALAWGLFTNKTAFLTVGSVPRKWSCIGVGLSESIQNFATSKFAVHSNELQRKHQLTAVRADSEDDGRALDTSGPTGFIGSIVVSLSILPYVALSLYSTYVLATTGSGIPPGPNGIYGAAEGIATLIVFGVTIWTIVSSLFRGGQGLPAGPLSILRAAQSLSIICVVAFGSVTALNKTVDPEDNPLRGLSLEALEKNPQTVLKKTERASAKISQVVLDNTVEQRTAVDTALKESQKKVAETVKLPDVKVPDIKVPDIKVPDIKVPEIKAPAFKAPEIKAPDIKLPEIKAPELKAPPLKVPDIKLPEVKVPEVKKPEVKAPETKAPAAKAPEVKPAADISELFD